MSTPARYRGLALGAGLLVSLLWSSAAAAAIVEGRLIHNTQPRAVVGLEVQVVGVHMDPNGEAIVRSTQTDARGRFRFDDLPAPAAYLVRAVYKGVVFPGGTAIFRPGEPESVPPLVVQVYEQSEDAAALSLGTLQWIVSREAGVYQVQAMAIVHNGSTSVVLVPPDAPPALRIALPAGHSDPAASFGRFPDGVTVEGDDIAIRGPVLPGEEALRLNYTFEIPDDNAALDTEWRFPSAADSVSLYVRDYGIAVDAGELFAARPAREDGSFYLSFVGFDQPAGTSERVQITPLAAAVTPPLTLTAAIVALLAGGLLYYVGRPIADSGAAKHAPEDDRELAHSEALAAALTDLEHDFETGKLSSEDRDRLRSDLEREAADAMIRERELQTAGTADEKRTCSCGREAGPEDRFCAGCGAEF